MLKIRLAARDDGTEIIRVRREAILSKAGTHYDQAAVAAWVGTDTADRLARIEREISDPGMIILVAEAGDVTIGFAMAIPAQNELRALYVRPNPVGQVGCALLAALEAQAFETAEFLVCDASLNAQRFYAANGYGEEGRKDHVSIPGGVVSGMVQMRKRRPSAVDPG